MPIPVLIIEEVNFVISLNVIDRNINVLFFYIELHMNAKSLYANVREMGGRGGKYSGKLFN